MSNHATTDSMSAARVVATTFGVLAGLGGITHGVGEVLQGSVAPDGIFVNSWTTGPIATNMGGEPGLTLVPNMLLTGLLAVAISLLMILWSLLFVQRRHGGRVLMLLAVLLLLTGGGVGPPLIGFLAGASGTGINRPLQGWRARLLPGSRRLLAALWPGAFALAAACGTLLVIGSVILVYVFDVNNAGLFLNLFYLTVLSLLANVLLAPFYDYRHSAQLAPAGD